MLNKQDGECICGHFTALDRVQAVNYFSPVRTSKPDWENLGRCAEPFAWNKMRDKVHPKDFSNWISVAFGTPTANTINQDKQLQRLIQNLPDEKVAEKKNQTF